MARVLVILATSLITSMCLAQPSGSISIEPSSSNNYVIPPNQTTSEIVFDVTLNMPSWGCYGWDYSIDGGAWSAVQTLPFNPCMFRGTYVDHLAVSLGDGQHIVTVRLRWWQPSIQDWYPGALSVDTTSVTMLRDPVTVSISGPGEMDWKDRADFTALAGGGRLPYSYEWEWRAYPSGSWSGVVNNQQVWNFLMQNYDVELKAHVTDYYLDDAVDTHVILLGGYSYSLTHEAESPALNIPRNTKVLQNYPNPFNPATEIKFTLAEDSFVRVAVLDMLGREISILVDQELPGGYRSVTWNGTDLSGRTVSSGVYFYHVLISGSSGQQVSQTMKMILTR